MSYAVSQDYKSLIFVEHGDDIPQGYAPAKQVDLVIHSIIADGKVNKDIFSHVTHESLKNVLDNNHNIIQAYKLATLLPVQKHPSALLNIIAKDAEFSYKYASEIINNRFPEGENEISKSAQYAYFYAKHVLKAPFPQGEEAISKHVNIAYLYADNVLKAPFPQAEDLIAKNSHYAYKYALYVLKGRFEKGEHEIAKNALNSYLYAKDVLNSPFEKGETTIATDDEYSYLYACDVLKGRFEMGEQMISQNPIWFQRYNKRFMDIEEDCDLSPSF